MAILIIAFFLISPLMPSKAKLTTKIFLDAAAEDWEKQIGIALRHIAFKRFVI